MMFFLGRIGASTLALVAALAMSTVLHAQDAGAVAPRPETGVMAPPNGDQALARATDTQVLPQALPTGAGAATTGASVPAALDEAFTLTWNTYAGGGANDNAFNGVVDASGAYYVVGSSSASWGAPVRAFTGAGTDAVVAKFDSNGALVWNTFLGSSSDDFGYNLAVDSNGRVYVTGYSYATWGAPVRAHAGATDAFVARLASNGALEWVTFLGGADYDRGMALALNGSDIYLAGVSRASWGAPVHAHTAYDDIMVARLNTAGALQWHTFHGGSQYEEATDIVVTGVNELYIAGYSDVIWGAPVTAHHGSRDAVVVRLNTGGTLVWHTFVGGAGIDAGLALAPNGLNGVILGGYSDATWANNPYNRFNGGRDGMITVVSSVGSVSWNTFLGSPSNDEVRALAVDASGNILYTGVSDATWGAPVDPFSSNVDAVVGKLNSSGYQQWVSFFGGSGNDRGVALAALSNGRVALFGESEGGWGAPVRAWSGGIDLFAALLPDYGSRVGQSISYSNLPVRTVGDPPFSLSNTATSGLPITFVASGQCTVQGNLVALTGSAGLCTLVANQEGSLLFAPAPDVVMGFQIVKANQTIDFAALPNKTYGDAPFVVNATATSGLPVVVSSSTPAICTVAGATVTIVAAGDCTLVASQAGNEGYNPAPEISRSFTVAKASQVITFDAPSNRTYGDPPFAINPTASSGLPVAVASSTPATCTVANTTVTIVAAGDCTLTAAQSGNGNYTAATTVSRTFTISKANQTIDFPALPNRTIGSAPFNISATASSGLPVTFASITPVICTVNGTTIALVTPGDCTIRAQQSGDGNYNAAPIVERSFIVQPAGSGFNVFLPLLNR